MGIEGLINGHDREPKTWHEYIDEEEGSKGAQCHEGQHGSRARVRCPAQIWGERRRQVILVSFDFLGERADKSTEFADTTPVLLFFSG